MEVGKSSVLIVDQMHASLSELLLNLGLDADYRPDIQREEIIRQINKYTGLIIRSKTPIDANVLENARQLRFIARAGSGLDLIDVKMAEGMGISVFNAPEGNRDAVAEHTLGMLLCLLHKIHIGNHQVRNMIWDREANRGMELKNKVIGIIGYGNIGRELAKRLSQFGCKILAYDKFRVRYSDDFAQEAEMEELYETADIISIHIPLNEKNRHLVNAQYLSRFKKRIILINTARGKIVDLQALGQALESGKVYGACLDVLENEKLHRLNPEQKDAFLFLKQQENVIFTPHVAGWTFESYERINQVLAEKIRHCLDL